MSKFKVGDKVKVKNNLEVGKYYGTNSFVSGMSNYRGKIWEVEKLVKSDTEYRLKDCSPWNFTDEMLEPAYCENSVHITTDGTTTTAILKDGKNVVKKAVAKCSPNDTFDFNVGAEIAFGRLFGKEPFKHCGSNNELKDYDFKMRCIDNDRNKGLYSIGEIYKVRGNTLYDSNGRRVYSGHLNSFEEWEAWTASKFELVTDFKPQVREVKRKAKVGEWVRFTDCWDNDDLVGKIGKKLDGENRFEHQIVWGQGYGSPKGYEKTRFSSPVEYVVLENYVPESKTYTQEEADKLIADAKKQAREEAITEIKKSLERF